MSAKITHRRRRAFLHALAASGNLTLSAERAKVSLRKPGLCKCPPDIRSAVFAGPSIRVFR